MMGTFNFNTRSSPWTVTGFDGYPRTAIIDDNDEVDIVGVDCQKDPD